MVGGEGEAVLDDDRLGLGLTTFEVNGPGLGLDVADALEAGKEVEAARNDCGSYNLLP